ncbi:MAG: hypothetical protein GF329_13040 [Candidatus Lokiarchaeota archaeon]|nr:hypothetical protein [Candidatus Lokiarchaeota archaeon]
MNIFLSASFRTDDDQKFLKRIKKILETEGNVVWTAKEHLGDYYGTLSGERLNEIIEIEKDEILKSDLVVVLIKSLAPEPLMQELYASFFDIPILVYLKVDENKALSLSPWIYYHGQVVKSEDAFLNAFRVIKESIENEYNK